MGPMTCESGGGCGNVVDMSKQPRSPGSTQELKPPKVDHDDTFYSPEVQRGAVLKALWEHRHEPLIRFDEALKDLPIPFDTKKGILKLLESGGLVQYNFEPLSDSLGNGRITFYGVQVQEEKRDPPISIVIHQHIQTGGVRMGDVTVGGGMNIATDQAQASQNEKKGVDLVKWISAVWRWVKALFGFGS